MKLQWTKNAREEYLYWQSTDKKILNRINTLIKGIMEDPFEGIGKPEPLKLNLSGKWSRRINDEHRLVYEVSGKNDKTGDSRVLTIYQCRYHY